MPIFLNKRHPLGNSIFITLTLRLVGLRNKMGWRLELCCQLFPEGVQCLLLEMLLYVHVFLRLVIQVRYHRLVFFSQSKSCIEREFFYNEITEIFDDVNNAKGVRKGLTENAK